MSEKSFFEELDKNLSSDRENDFSYKPLPPEKDGKSWPVVLIGLGIVFVAVVIILFSELLSTGDKSNEATLPEASITTEMSDELSAEDIEKAEDALEDASTENVKPALEKPEVPQPTVKKNVQQIKAPPKISSKKHPTTKKIVKKSIPPAQVIPTGWQVQLAAVSSRTSAENEWTRLSKKHAVLSGQKYAVIEKSIQGRTLYRLRVVGLASRDVADTLCATLQTQNLACIVIR
ncbi:MAG: SPOR domain-containing protein [Alphaproteobacteria bacterium]